MEVLPNRIFNVAYIMVDSIFLLFLALFFLATKRKMAFLVGVLGAFLYFVVDYGGFYLLLGTRKVIGMNPALLLLWLSTSYGFTNMSWMFLWFDEEKNRKEWSVLFCVYFFSVAILTAAAKSFPSVTIERGTAGYHWIFALFLIVGYAYICVENLLHPENKSPLLSILAIGILIQLAWEGSLFLASIRQTTIRTLFVDCLLETNLGAPFMFLIQRKIRTAFPSKINGGKL